MGKGLFSGLLFAKAFTIHELNNWRSELWQPYGHFSQLCSGMSAWPIETNGWDRNPNCFTSDN